MGFQIRVSLAAAQLDAAGRLHSRLAFWKATDEALDDLSRRIPSFNASACLIKASAINQLYSTNVYALPAMAEHIAEVIAGPSEEDLVERLALLNGVRHVSFASKFAHFFIDSERYPIFDGYAHRMLRYHLIGVPAADPPPYAEYAGAHRALIELCGLACSGRELDRYLWLGGLYAKWLKDHGAKINSEASRLFVQRDRDASIDADLMALKLD